MSQLGGKDVIVLTLWILVRVSLLVCAVIAQSPFPDSKMCALFSVQYISPVRKTTGLLSTNNLERSRQNARKIKACKCILFNFEYTIYSYIATAALCLLITMTISRNISHLRLPAVSQSLILPRSVPLHRLLLTNSMLLDERGRRVNPRLVPLSPNRWLQLQTLMLLGRLKVLRRIILSSCNPEGSPVVTMIRNGLCNVSKSPVRFHLAS